MVCLGTTIKFLLSHVKGHSCFKTSHKIKGIDFRKDFFYDLIMDLYWVSV